MKIKTNQRTFDLNLSEDEIRGLYLVLKDYSVVTNPAYKLKDAIEDALGYKPQEDIY